MVRTAAGLPGIETREETRSDRVRVEFNHVNVDTTFHQVMTKREIPPKSLTQTLQTLEDPVKKKKCKILEHKKEVKNQ